MNVVVTETTLPGLRLLHRGKVRDTYDLGDQLLMVATDRLSAFDVVLPTPIPGKGQILTGLSAFWFTETVGLLPNHLVTTDLKAFPPVVQPYAELLGGRTMLVRRAERIDIECVVRGYLAGSAWEEYRAKGTVGGEELPAGLRLGDRLPEPMFTPAAKVDDGHDVNLTRQELVDHVGEELADRLEMMSLNLFLAASELVESRQLLLADTKFEFGLIDGELRLIDELLTPDSSRYWDANSWMPGRSPAGFDKQFVRDWLLSSGWDKEPPGPELPPEVVAGTQDRYAEVYRRITGVEPPGGTLAETVMVTGSRTLGDAELATERWSVEVAVLPRAGVNDPEGEAILGGLQSLGFAEVRQVRAGSLFRLEMTAATEAEVALQATAMAERLLANPVIQSFEVRGIDRVG